MEPSEFNYLMLIDKLKASGHLDEMLQGIQPTAVLFLLSRIGLQDARAIASKPGRIAPYIKTHQRKLINSLDNEETVALTVALWLQSQLVDLYGLDFVEQDSMLVIPNELFDRWVQDEEWWKVALAVGITHLERADDVSFDSELVETIVDMFAPEDTAFAAATANRLSNYLANLRKSSDLDKLLKENQRLAAELSIMAAQLESEEALPTEDQLSNLFNDLRRLNQLFAEVQRDLIEHAVDISLPSGIIHPADCTSLGQLAESYRYVSRVRDEYECEQRVSMREQVASVLQSVLNLARIDGLEMPELEIVKEKAQSLLHATQIMSPDIEASDESVSLRDGVHPLAVLLRTVSDGVRDDDDLLSTDTILSEAFGRKLAVLALSGRLTLQAPVSEEGATGVNALVPDMESTIDKSLNLTPTTDSAGMEEFSTGPGEAELPILEEETLIQKVEFETAEDDKVTEQNSNGQSIDLGSKEQSSETDGLKVPVPAQAQAPPLPSLITESDTALVAAEQEELGDQISDVFHHFVRSGDVPGAYWLLRSREEQGNTYAIPSWLLAAVQGSLWLNHAHDRVADDLTDIARHNEPPADLANQLLAIAAALVPALVAPTTGLSFWLGLSRPPELAQLIEAVESYASHGYALRPEDLLGVSGQAQLAVTVEEIAKQAERWIEEAPSRRIQFGRANDVWRKWVSQKGDLLQIIHPVANNDQGAVDGVHKAIADWLSETTANRLNAADVALHGAHLRPIVGSARNKLVKDTDEALHLAREWCELVVRLKDVQSRGNWFLEQMQQLIAGVQEAMPEAMTWLHRLAQGQDTEIVTTAAIACLSSLNRLSVLLKLTELDSKSANAFADGYLWDSTAGLWNMLAHRLLLLPEANLDDNLQPTSDTLRALEESLLKVYTEGRTYREAFEGWVSRQDYRFCSLILSKLSDDPDIVDLNRRWQEAMSGSHDGLSSAIQEASDAIQQGIIDATITEEEKADFDADVEAVRQSEDTQNYARLYERLDQVCLELQQARIRRIAHQHDLWNEIRDKLGSNTLDELQRDQIVQSVQEALEQEDTIVVDELLASLSESMDRGENPNISQFVYSPNQRDVFEEFCAVQPRLNDILNNEMNLQEISAEIGENKTGDLLPRPLPNPRIGETKQAFQAWRQLTLGKVLRFNAELLCTVLHYLGFSITLPPPECVKERQRGKDWIYLQVNMSASNLSPVPQFGSMQEGNYHVVCLWERPSLDTIGALLYELKLHNNDVLILYFGRIKTNQRNNLMRFTHSRNRPLSVAVIDEILLVFLAREHESRLPTFLACALPLAHMNPYVATGVVMPEMFFGREEMIQSLQSPSGAAIVYGGRQLGKSALLRRVAREFHQPNKEQYSLYEDIKLVGDPTSGQNYDELLWRRLRDGLSRLGLLDMRAETSATILRKIREAMDAVPHRQVLVLLDEADKFLQADEAKNFRIVSELKQIMDDTNRRFKIVFAGLHDVQRFQNIPNQPLAHLPSLKVGPLEPHAAQQLIRFPMKALGFRFADIRPILRILAYTNYHPGLIQLFCHELLDLLREQPATSLGPRMIEHTDIERVYRKDNVRDEMRKRFDWTLALDRRYKAIAYALIYDQMEDRDGYGKAYSLAAMLDLGRYWWIKGFGELTRNQFEGILLEMCGLGVLVRNTHDHRYHLRSPNLVRLMGPQKDIEDTLLELSAYEPEMDSIIPDSHRAPLDETARRYSPFTYAQSSILRNQSFGVGLVFGSEALGLRAVPDASQKFIPTNETGLIDGEWEELRFAGNSGGAIEQSLQKFLKQHDNTSRLVTLRHMAGSPRQLVEQVEAALSFCKQYDRRRRQWMRVILLFDTVSTWEWLNLTSDTRSDLESLVDATVWLTRWDSIGIRQRLDQHGKISSPENCQRLLDRTGGWPWLLDKVSECWTEGTDNPLEGTESLWQTLEEPDDDLRTQFLVALGLGTAVAADNILGFIASNMSVPSDYILLEMMDEQHGFSEQECVTAVEYLRRLGMIDVYMNPENQENEIRVEPVVKKLLNIRGLV